MKRIGFLAILLVFVACGPTGGGMGDDDTGGDDGGDDTGGDDTGDDTQTMMPDASHPQGTGEPGSECSCDADCADDGANPGACIYGVCMTMATGPCASAGSQGECAAGSRCWNLTDFDGGSICWPDCSAHTCAGTCDGDGSCVPTADSNCDGSCGTACSCTADSCGDGLVCVDGGCVPEAAGAPGPGPGPTCTGLPTRDCVGADCGTLVYFDPRTTAAYDDYPINGETAANQYRSYLRKDLMMLLKYATAKVACKTAAWTAGNGGALGYGDMSEANGAIPGTSIGSPGHPAGTHTNGYDIDLGYFQSGTADNRLRPICPHTSAGAEANHCTAAPTNLDLWRHAMFLGIVFESARTRVIGVDGQAGPQLVSAIDTLCDSGWLDATACNNVSLAYETTDQGLGWYYFHHHHSHISLEQAAFTAPLTGTVKALPGRAPPGLHAVK